MRDSRCAACGYDLIGLPGSGRCPECGERYDKETRLNVSDRTKPAAPGGAGRWRFPLIALGLAGAVVAIGGVYGVQTADPLRPISASLVLAAALLMAALWSLGR
ncbi:hypothetical protein [Phycisphaera mikurensis]|uniref:Uncharacterized protein n=1 Tax=Phycisphaera mikurensis (strain NBRC 102666 / KCTC 22515 / FYK2301M01) TaxID=1142394 RepID=I0IEH5_PHYMF|nr:hypothetical protein [Phycisphaera mikurensis]MBB6441462.1 hypothetical protein [Phycisphaera mikurensis]BAM03663.1 hypothetical protein PSMK_15040 [Phycisphaera mikurensis NBRC 102666]